MEGTPSEREHEILAFINLRHECHYLEVINAFDPAVRCNETRSLLEHLISLGMVESSKSRSHHSESYVSLTPRGVSALSSYKDACEKRAKQDAEKEIENIQRIKDRKQERRDKWLIAIFSTCFGYVLRLCIENFEVALVFLRSFFFRKR